MSPLRTLLIAATSAIAAAGLNAQTIYYKANNNTALNVSSSYVGSPVTTPGSLDTISINSTVTAATSVNLGANLSVNQIALSNPTGNFTLASGFTLTLGGGGFSMGTATANLIVNSGITLGANQNWTVNTRALQIGNSAVLTQGAFTANVSGNGTLDWRSNTATSFAGPISINIVSVNSASANLTLTNAANSFTALNIPNGKVVVSGIDHFGVASAAGSGGSSTAIGLASTNATGIFEYAGGNVTSNRTFNLDRRSNGGSILVTNPDATLTLSNATSLLSSLGNATGEKDITYTLGGSGNLVVSGAIADHSGASYVTAINKTGAGVLTLGGTNGYLGTTTVTEGTLLVNGSTQSASTVTVAAAGTLGGSGTINGLATINGTHSPGNSPGIQTFAGGLTYNTDAIVNWELAANTSTQGDPTAVYDQVIVGDTSTDLTFAGSTTLNLSFNTAGSTVNWNNAFWGSNQSWKIYDSAAVNGFGNLSLATSNWVDGSGNSFNSVRGGSTFGLTELNGDIYLNYAIPEPSTYAALLGLGVLVVVACRRRRMTS